MQINLFDLISSNVLNEYPMSADWNRFVEKYFCGLRTDDELTTCIGDLEDDITVVLLSERRRAFTLGYNMAAALMRGSTSLNICDMEGVAHE